MKNEPGNSTAFSALILSSGLSERMGQSKALLQWDEQTTFLEKIINEYLEAGCRKVVCTVNRFIMPRCLEMKVAPNVKFILNEHPEWGRMYSVRLGLAKLKNSDFCFLQNVDNPFTNQLMLEKLKTSADDQSWCSPEFEGQGGHPVVLPAVIISKILEGKNLDVTLQDILKLFPRKTVEMADDLILRNINTPEDYRRFLG